MALLSQNMPVSDRLLFLHVPKTAGTSVRFVVKNLYADDELIWIYPNKPWAHLPHEMPKLTDATKASARMVYADRQ